MYSFFSLKGKTILVTGASSNIGKHIAIRCSEMGANIIANGRNSERLHETLDSLDSTGHHSALCADLANEESLVDLVRQLPVLDGIVFCAATFRTTPVRHCKREHIEDIFTTNAFCNFDMTHLLLKSKKIAPNASIVFISSVASDRPYKGNSLYSATKGAINSFAKVLALELGSSRIRVNCISPGFVLRDTGIREGVFTTEEQQQEMGKYPLGVGEPDDVAFASIYLLSDAAKWVTGTNLTVDGGQSII